MALTREELLAMADRMEEQGHGLIAEAASLREHAEEAHRKRYNRVDYGTAREVAHELRSFTGPEFTKKLAARCGVSHGAANKALERICDEGLVTRTNLRRQSQGSTRGLAYVYELVPHTPESYGDRPRPKLPTPEELAARDGGGPDLRQRGRAIPAGRLHVPDKELDALLGRALATGIRHNKQGAHVKLYPTDGGPPVSFPNRQGDAHTLANVKQELTRRGCLDDE